MPTVVEQELVMTENRVVEAGELKVNQFDSVLPTKLIQLGHQGWAITDAWKLKEGGFTLLFTRKTEKES